MDQTELPAEGRRARIERLRGMSDIDPGTYLANHAVQEQLLALFRQHGYQTIDTPILEHTELFLRKSGGERVAQMYAFSFRDRDIALRPEFTASALRSYVDSMQSSPLPVRLSYAGPVFRYERPQAGRSRQFTDLGVELIGGSGSQADAEVIHLALEVLGLVGVPGKLVLGHIGIVLDFLKRLPLRQRARDWLIWSMDRLQKGLPVDVEAELPGLVSGDRLPEIFQELGHSVQQVSQEELERWVLAVLHEVGIQMHGGTRGPDEIVAGVVAKMHQSSDADDVRKAFAFISELVGVRGKPSSALPELRGLVRRHGLDEAPINEIEATLELLDAYGVEPEHIELNLGLGRGLHYYTGILFEIYDLKRGGAQLCGGGRYDELAQALGAREATPACGFSFGLERLVQAANWTMPIPDTSVLVAPLEGVCDRAAVQVAERLRAEGKQVEIDVRGRSSQANRRYAQRRGIPMVLFVDADGEVREELVERATSPQADSDDQ